MNNNNKENRPSTINLSLFDKLSFILEKYLDKQKIEEFLKKERIFDFIYKYWYWFKATNVLNIVESDFKNDFYYSQKLSLRIVMSISLIENFCGNVGEKTILDFFSKLNLYEKFLFNWIIFIKDDLEEVDIKFLEKCREEAAKDYIQLERSEERIVLNLLLSSLLSNQFDLINQEFGKRIRYLYALRSQIVHRGESSISVAIFTKPFPDIIKVAFISSFPKKRIEKKLLAFQDYNKYGMKFEDVFEDLIFVSLLRNEDIGIKKEFLEQFKMTFYKILEKIQKFSSGDIYSPIRRQLYQYLAKSKNNKT